MSHPLQHAPRYRQFDQIFHQKKVQNGLNTASYLRTIPRYALLEQCTYEQQPQLPLAISGDFERTIKEEVVTLVPHGHCSLETKQNDIADNYSLG